MKKIIVFLTMIFSLNASAHGYLGGAGTYYDWLTPLVLGGVGGYLIGQARNPPPQVIVVQPGQAVTVSPNQLLAPAPPGYYYDNLYDPSCYCYRLVLIPR